MTADDHPSVATSAEVSSERLSQLYAALSQVNQAIVRMPTRSELLQAICRVLVEHGGYGMAWIGWHDKHTQGIICVADAGDTPAICDASKFTSTTLSPRAWKHASNIISYASTAALFFRAIYSGSRRLSPTSNNNSGQIAKRKSNR